MDFLNPKKERRVRTMLLLGYALVALAIGIATLILLYISYGYSIDKKGKVTQNGLVFVSSQPTNSAIFLNNTRYQSATNTRMVLPAGSFNMQITATGYRGWQRQIVVAGNDVQHFDYPFLFPETLHSTTVAALPADPSFYTQSTDKRWLLLGEAGVNGRFIEQDLKSPRKPVQTEIVLPPASFTAATGEQTWTATEWASDSRHLLLLHSFTNDAGKATHEYVLVDRDTPVSSINLTAALKLTDDDSPSLFNKKVDQFYIYSASAQTLKVVPADNGTTISQLDHVLAYKTYGDGLVLYATDKPPTGKTPTGEVSLILQNSQKTTTLRTLPAGATSYLFDLAQYAGDLYVATAANTDAGVYLYKNPQNQVTSDAKLPIVWRRLAISHPTYISFSNNTQFFMAESGQEFTVYDAENIAQYRYTAKLPMDQPQTHATWMDGDRLQFISRGKLAVFDYDNRNLQTLQAASANYLPSYAPDYSYVYVVKPGADVLKPTLTSTALTVPAK